MEPKSIITTQVSQTSQNYIIKCVLTKKLPGLIDGLWKQYQIKSFQNRGKYKQFKYSFNHQQHELRIAINKRYYFDVLMHKKYQLVVFAKCILGMSQEFLQTQKALTETAKSKLEGISIVSIDVLALTLVKQFTVLNPQNQYQVKKLFLRVSLLEFRRNLVSKSKQCDQHFSAIVIRMKKKSAMLQEDQQMEQRPQYIPSDQSFYKAPRVAFLDDLYTNQSLLRRFNRFIIFYQIHSLFLGTIPLQHPLIKQFYQRCSLRCSIISTRLKRMLIQFRFSRPQSASVFREHTATLTLGCVEQDFFKNEKMAWEERNGSNERFKFPDTNKEGNLFLVQLYCDSLQIDKKVGSYNKIHEKFFLYLRSIINDPKTQTSFLQYYDINTVANAKMLRIKNEVGFCQILVELSQFIDVLCYSTLVIFSSHQPRTNIPDESYQFKLPVGRLHNRGPKFSIYYSVEIKITVQSKKQKLQGQAQREVEVQINEPSKQSKQRSDRQGCVHSLSRIIMSRKKVADSNSVVQHYEYTNMSDSLKGLSYYVKQLLSKQNVRDCFNQVLEIVTCNMNFVADKNASTSNSFKKFTYVRMFASNLNHLLEAFTKILSSIDTLFIIRIINAIQEFTEIEDKQPKQIKSWLTFTFQVRKITMAGWMELVPLGSYQVQVNKQKIYIGKRDEERQEDMTANTNYKDKEKLDKVTNNLKNYFTKSFNSSWLDHFKFWNESRQSKRSIQ